MYGLKRLASASHLGLRALFTSPADATLYIQIKSKAGKIQSKNVAIGASKERKLLPPELQSENVAMLTCDSSAGGGKCDVYFVGTRHYTPESKREVEAVIQFLKPEVVFLELCSSRITPEREDNLKRAGSYYLDPEVEEVGILGDAGKSDLIAAYMQGLKCGAKVILGDRPMKAVMFYDYPTCFFSSYSGFVDYNVENNGPFISIWDMIKSTCVQLKLLPISDAERDFWEKYPFLTEPLLDERNQYMSAKILEAAREHNLVVAVVGRAHLAGIPKYWKQPVELEQLLKVPTIKNPIIYVAAVIINLFI